MIEVIAVRGLTTVQDLGRAGLAHLGVPPCGAADAPALRLANRLVGNDEGAAALEATIAGPRLRFLASATVALTGAPTRATLAGAALQMDVPHEVGAEELLDLGVTRAGARTYLAVRGGIDVAAVLGSRATDTLTGLGPAPLRAGDLLAVAGAGAGAGGGGGGGGGRSTAEWAAGAAGAAWAQAHGREPEIRVVPGPRADWFAEQALDLLAGGAYTVSPASDRIGVRLDGPPLQHARTDELLSEGMVTGSLQVPSSGLPILLGVDHPTTGGYPVLAVAISDDLPLIGQLRPGQTVRFRMVEAPDSGS